MVLNEEGRIKLGDGRTFSNPSAAAKAVTGTEGVNGYRFWRATCPDGQMRTLEWMRDMFPGAFQKRNIKWHTSMVYLPEEEEEGEDSNTRSNCVDAWKEMVTRCAGRIIKEKKAIHPEDISQTAVVFELQNPTSRPRALTDALVLQSRRLSLTNPCWAFRGLVRKNGQVVCFSSSDVDVVIGDGVQESVAIEIMNGFLETVNKHVKGVRTETKRSSSKLKMHCYAPNISANEVLLRDCIKYAADHVDTQFFFSNVFAILHVKIRPKGLG